MVQQHSSNWAVIGAGPAGIAAVGQLIDKGVSGEQILWIDPKFKVAPYDVAMNFSFEYRPEILYEMTGHKLPFGCHAWMKCNPQFWSNILMN